MTRVEKKDKRKNNECGEVKGVALNLTRSSEKLASWERAEPLILGAGHVAQTVATKSVAATPGSKTASSRTTTGK